MKSRMLHAFFALPLLLAAALAHGAGNVSATYAVFQSGHEVGETNEKFIRNGNTYRIESETKATGVYSFFAKGAVKLISSGEIGKDGLRPLHFEYHRGGDASKLSTADFDWAKNTLTLRHDGKTETLPLEAGTQDRLSQNYQFMFVNHPQKSIVYAVTDGRSLNKSVFNLLGAERADTGQGGMKALRYSRERKADEQSVDVWLAEQRGYFPVRIAIKKSETDVGEQVMTDIKFR